MSDVESPFQHHWRGGPNATVLAQGGGSGVTGGGVSGIGQRGRNGGGAAAKEG